MKYYIIAIGAFAFISLSSMFCFKYKGKKEELPEDGTTEAALRYKQIKDHQISQDEY